MQRRDELFQRPACFAGLREQPADVEVCRRGVRQVGAQREQFGAGTSRLLVGEEKPDQFTSGLAAEVGRLEGRLAHRAHSGKTVPPR